MMQQKRLAIVLGLNLVLIAGLEIAGLASELSNYLKILFIHYEFQR